MSLEKSEIFCPLILKKIEKIICEDVSTAAEGMQPARFAPKEFRNVQEWKEKCMECLNHPE